MRQFMLAEGDTAISSESRGPVAWFRSLALNRSQVQCYRDYGQHVSGAILFARCLGRDTFRFIGEK